MFVARVVILNRFHPKIGAYFKNIEYLPGGGKWRSLDIAIPPYNPPYPILVFIHGGGFFSGDKKLLTRVCKCYAREGFLVFNLNYRLAPEFVFPAQFEDTHLAVRWVYENAERFGGDPERIFLGGESAGASLSALYAAASIHPKVEKEILGGETIKRDSIKGLLLFYGVYDFETVLETGFPDIYFITHIIMGEDEELYKERAALASPLRLVDKNYPPCFVCSSERDYLHPESVRFARALGSHGVECETLFFDLERYPHAYHGFIPAFFFECTRMAMERSANFMRRQAGIESFKPRKA